MKLNSMMKHHTYTPKSLKVSGLRLIGGGKTLNISVLRNSLIPLSLSFIVSFLCLACSKETSVSQPQYPEMQAYYVESCHLNVAATDSVQRFMQKVDTFVTHHSDAKQDPLYPRIQENIRSASFRLNINVDDEWDGEYNMTF